MAADELSDLLRTVRLTGATFFNVAGTDPWVVESAPRDVILPKVLPGADHLIAYHAVTQGQCFVALAGGEPITLRTGEIVVFTNCDAHVLSSSPGMRTATFSTDAFEAALSGPLPFVVKSGGDGPVSTRIVCGYLACDARPFNPLLENLPPVIKAGRVHQDGDNWLAQFMRLAALESADRRAGSEGMLAKLSELMFIEVLRSYLEALPPEQAGWLSGLRDPVVGKALSLMHAAPAAGWTLDELARQAAASRSVLAERFTAFVGVPPMHYLARWRMQIACELLSGGAANMAAIAAQIGYESEASFSRAFKNIMGIAPSLWREGKRSPG